LNNGQARTLPILDAVIAQLELRMPDFAVEYFPDNPVAYRLNNPTGALLVSYAGSAFQVQPGSGQNAVSLPSAGRPQSRLMGIVVTVVLRQLNGREGAIGVLDDVRDALRGFKPPGCRSGVVFTRERFLGQVDGLWQYALDAGTTTWDGAPGQTS
jgi:hypothetical protein